MSHTLPCLPSSDVTALGDVDAKGWVLEGFLGLSKLRFSLPQFSSVLVGKVLRKQTTVPFKHFIQTN
jgi:hypothetical protein